jgi:hypothetical protein
MYLLQQLIEDRRLNEEAENKNFYLKVSLKKKI